MNTLACFVVVPVKLLSHLQITSVSESTQVEIVKGSLWNLT
jgi:hypothetical protein